MTGTFQRVCVAFMLALLLGSETRAQFRLDIDQLASVTNEREELDSRNETPQGPNQLQVRQNIDAWAFNQHGNASQARKFLDRQLKAKLGNYTELLKLSEAQQTKLALAGHSDIAGYFAEIDVIRSEFGETVHQQEFNKVWQRVQPLQMQMQRGLFSHGSMFSKIIQRTLDPAQREQCEAREQERLGFAYQAAIKLTISELEKSVLLLESQRREIMALLLKAGPPNVVGQYINYYVLYRLSQSQQPLNQILKPGQQKALSQALNQGQAMGQFLKQNGIID